ncbi:U4/U6.U5 small nuclear ribonucleoprotein 27 kDa protein [Balaenoptera musculus]|nr:U4/U6.U5 small nuclear ribonucleoprotein 27 kDa protein [Balaenoptera musculus]
MTPGPELGRGGHRTAGRVILRKRSNRPPSLEAGTLATRFDASQAAGKAQFPALPEVVAQSFPGGRGWEDSEWSQPQPVPRRERRRSRSTSRERERRRRERSRSRERDRRRSRSRSPHRRRSRSPRRHRSTSPSPSRLKERRDEEKKETKETKSKERQITEEDLEGKTEEEIEMMKLMGFASFDSTKGKKVDGSVNAYAINVSQKRKYRQYMNRKGGFNRPLDFIA